MNENKKLSTDDAISNLQVRQHLVVTAVNFLINPDVRNQSNQSKTAFLRKKGLNDSEIAAAFEKANVDPGNITTASRLSDQQAGFIPNTSPYPERTVSFWTRLNRISTSLAVLALALYGLHRFYKLYVEPWLFGTKSERNKNTMEELMVQLNNSICELKTAVSTLESTVNSQKEQIDQVLLCENSPYMPIPLAVAELKSEIGSLKSLLINRHQFPAVPKVYNPSIPLWQLPASDSENAESESKANEFSGDTVEDKSIELKSEADCPIECDKPYFDQSSVKTLENNGTETISDKEKLAGERQLPDSDIAESQTNESYEGIAPKTESCDPRKCDKPDSNRSLAKAAEIIGVQIKTNKEIATNDLELAEKINGILQSDDLVSPSTLVKDHVKMNGTHLEDACVSDDNEFKDAIQSSD